MKTSAILLALLICVSCSRQSKELTTEQKAIVARYEAREKELELNIKAQSLLLNIYTTSDSEHPATSKDIDEAMKVYKYQNEFMREKFETEIAKLKYIAEHKYTH